MVQDLEGEPDIRTAVAGPGEQVPLGVPVQVGVAVPQPVPTREAVRAAPRPIHHTLLKQACGYPGRAALSLFCLERTGSLPIVPPVLPIPPVPLLDHTTRHGIFLGVC
jgi:hypothetical protein